MSTRFVDRDRVHPAIENITSHARGGRGKPQQRAVCAHQSCDRNFSQDVNGKFLTPLKKFRASAARYGWVFDAQTEEFYCSDHKPEPTVTQKNTEPKTDSPAPNRVMTPADRRAIFREIDGSYDESSQAYVLDVTDQSIAKIVGVPWGWVAQVREENFGPSGPDPRLLEAEQRLAGLAKQVSDVETEILNLAEVTEKLKKFIQSENATIEKLKKGAV